ncbi:MAG: DUF1178 family protein [Desulfobacterales bacterium]|uniref:DUF1178 family protein n=1 Tax=Candidatus Desulfaltia bathyphila TaxID=2841697 RepID=A0A8J6TAK1_9BACT|nr:DUF1178 family protein [Candidatus Desulfaltia bathyphila]MBL7194731.1 DUF1178 family protein [Desulfobacterales bacterium]MBL7206948.1 DUF1178 family protein [Desulfobacterales bacterium]
MILFDLKCSNGHTFEGWFDDSRAFDKQKAKSMIACPVCEDTAVSKVPSTFAIKASQLTADSSCKHEDLENIGKKIADFVKNNFEDVGCKFTTEALKMHYGVSEPKNIRGTSTEKEEKILKDEGINFFKIPVLTDQNTDT